MVQVTRRALEYTSCPALSPDRHQTVRYQAQPGAPGNQSTPNNIAGDEMFSYEWHIGKTYLAIVHLLYTSKCR